MKRILMSLAFVLLVFILAYYVGFNNSTVFSFLQKKVNQPEDENLISVWGESHILEKNMSQEEKVRVIRESIEKNYAENYLKERNIQVTDEDLRKYQQFLKKRVREDQDDSNESVKKKLQWIENNPRKLLFLVRIRKTQKQLKNEYNLPLRGAYLQFIKEEIRENDLKIPKNLKVKVLSQL